MFIAFVRSDHQGFSIEADEVTSTQLLFTVPEPALTNGDGYINVGVGPDKKPGYSASVESCTGAATCTVTAFRMYEHTATITAL